jgi:hypothetical protein
MTASMVHVTNLTPPRSCNPSRACGKKTPIDDSQYIVHVTNLTPPGVTTLVGRTAVFLTGHPSK